MLYNDAGLQGWRIIIYIKDDKGLKEFVGSAPIYRITVLEMLEERGNVLGTLHKCTSCSFTNALLSFM